MKRVGIFLLTWLAWVGQGCDKPGVDIRLLTSADWKEAPGTAAEIGFWVEVDVGWPDKATSCEPLPSKLHVTVNGREAVRYDFYLGDCVWDVLYRAGPFTADMGAVTTVRVLDGNRLLGEATYDGLFPGCTLALANPDNTKVNAGGTLAVQLPSPASNYLYCSFYWLDPLDGVPPFSSGASGEIQSDGKTYLISVPKLTGRAALVANSCPRDYASARSCTGFSSCVGLNAQTTSPIGLEIVP